MHSNEKIQKLANAFNCEMVKSNYDQLSARYRTECFLCQIEIFSSNKKTGALEALLDHIKTIHSEQVKSSFIPSVMGYSAFEVNAAELVQEVFLKRPAMVWIIDRENAGQIEKPPMFTNDHLWVEVVNKNNKNLAKGRFLAASSNKKDAADILISILVANLLSQTDAEVKLITKDHFGEVLEEITKSLHDHRMRSLEPNAIMGFQGQE